MSIDWIILLSGILNILVGWVVWRSDPKNKLNIFFGVFVIIVFIQIFLDFLFRIFPTLFVLKSAYATAILIPLSASLWIFEITGFRIRKKLYRILFFLPGLIFPVLSFVDGLMVREIKNLSILGYEGVLGPLFSVYTVFLSLYVASFIIILYRAQRAATENVRRAQLRYTLLGILLYAGFAIVFSFILPIVFHVYSFTLLDAPSFIFFIGFTGYAITKHHLFNVKVVATELLTFSIWIALLVKTLLSENVQDTIFNGSLLLFVVFFGILLIRSVLKEVRQREKIEELNKEITRAYGVEKKAKEDTARALEMEKKANTELQELDRVKNQFLMTAQHDLRKPLTSVRGFLDLLLEGILGKQNKKTIESANKLKIAVEDSVEEVGSFLDVAQFQMGKGGIILKPGVDLLPILDRVVRKLSPLAEGHEIYLKLEKPEKLPMVDADAPKLKAAISNIVDNAIKYTPKGGVTVKAEAADGKVHIMVADTGIGVPKDKLESIFTAMFERTEQAKQTTSFGKGIGLPLSANIIKDHHGRVWAESAGENKGSVFHIELPVGAPVKATTP